MPKAITPPRIFISYSWTSEKHKQWVLNFADSLVNDGVDVILDRYMLKPGQDNINFMEIMVSDDIKHVLVICDKGYQDKANKRKGGVGIESQIISPKVYKDVSQTKFIPLIKEFDNQGNACVPVFFEARNFIDISTDTKYFKEYENILRLIFEKPSITKPKIGSPPDYIIKDKKQSAIIRKYQMFENALLNEKHIAKGLFSDLLDQFITEWPNYVLYPFKGEDGKQFDDAVINSIEEFSEYREIYLSALLLLTKFQSDLDYIPEIQLFFERTFKFTQPTREMHNYNEIWFDNFKYYLYDLYLNTITVLIENRKYAAYLSLIESNFVYERDFSKQIGNFPIFNFYIKSLDALRKERLKLNRTSIQVDTLKENVDKSGKVKFENIMQSDCLLFLRSIVTNEKHSWFPRTLIYAGYDTQLDLFIRAQNKKDFKVLANLIGVDSKSELLEKLNNSEAFGGLNRTTYFMWGNLEMNRLINLENLYNGEI